MRDIYLSLGTNLGDRQSNLLRALELLKASGIEILRASSVYETAAWGKQDQPDFLNQIIEVECEFPPPQLLKVINKIEEEMGRVRVEKWGERLIDIDILYHQSAIINQPNLTIPHAQIQNRRFILEPLVELAPHFQHPVLKKNQTVLLKDLKDDLRVSMVS